MINEKILLENGYKKWEAFNPYANASYQKCIKDERGKKYYISVNEYKDYFQKEITTYEFDFAVEVKGFGTIKTLAYALQKLVTIDEIEERFEKMWESLGSNYYEEFE